MVSRINDPSGIPGEQVGMIFYILLAFCCIVVLAGVVLLVIDGVRGSYRADEDVELARAKDEWENQSEALLPRGREYYLPFFFSFFLLLLWGGGRVDPEHADWNIDVNREGHWYGTVPLRIRVDDNLDRNKTWMVDWREGNYLSDCPGNCSPTCMGGPNGRCTCGHSG